MRIYNITKGEIVSFRSLSKIRDKIKCLIDMSGLVDIAIRCKNKVYPDKLEFRVNGREMSELYWRSAMRENVCLCMNDEHVLCLYPMGIPFKMSNYNVLTLGYN